MTVVSVGWRLVAALPLLTLQLLWVLSEAPPAAKAAPLALLVIAVWRPGPPLVLLAGMAPLVGIAGVWLSLPVHGARFYEQLVVATLLASLLTHRSFTAVRLITPGVAFMVLAAASALVVMPNWWLLDSLQPSLGEQWAMLRDGGLFAITSAWRPVHAALLIILGVGLAVVTEQTVRATPSTNRALLWALVTGGTVAAGLNLLRLWTLASSREASFLELFATLRLNTQLDINAAGSVFALLVVAGIGLLQRHLWQRVIAGGAVGVMAAGGLWLSGSRAAMVAAFAVVVLALVVAALRARLEHRRAVLAGIGALVVLGAAAVAVYPAKRNFAVSSSIDSRLILYRTAVDMWREAPMWGIGIGTFAERSVEYGSAAIDAILETGKIKENAHNYFLQVLAELGVVGLVVFVWLLAAAMWPTVRTGATPLPHTFWMTAGLVAYLVTSLTGHPQLLSEAVMPFWILLGCVAGSWPAPARAGHPLRAGLAVVAVLLLMATMPARTSHLRDHAQLEHRGLRVSLWHTSDDGIRYRDATRDSTVFVPTGHAVVLPIRLAPGSSSPITVDVWIDNELVNQVDVHDDTWTPVQLDIRQSRRRFVALRVSGPAEAAFQIGRAHARVLR